MLCPAVSPTPGGKALGTWPLSTPLVVPPSSLIKRFNLTFLLSVFLRHQALSHFLAFVFGESELFAIVYLVWLLIP